MEVIDGRRAHQLPTGYVTVRTSTDDTDEQVAKAAGFNPRRHCGYSVTRYDGAALVALWND